MLKRGSRLALAVGASLLASSPGFTVPNSFHLMQIEQVIGGVNGDVTRQAIQLRQRALGNNFVSFTRVRAWNAAGGSPVVIVDMTTDVINGAAGDRILIATSNFLPGLTPDFVMTAIPASYLPAGKLTFEDDSGTLVYWGLAWGGAAYTGTNTGTTDNDLDGIFSPPAFPGPLQSANTQSVRFPGAFSAPSTNNGADYALSVGAAVFTNNAGANGTVPVDLIGFTVR
jgi:hypothetical protein